MSLRERGDVGAKRGPGCRYYHMDVGEVGKNSFHSASRNSSSARQT